MENGYRNGVSKNGHANGTPKVESVNGANAKSTIQLERPPAVVNPRPAAAVKEQRAQLRGIGVVGLGYWGPNWVRNLHQSQAAGRIVACDLDQKRRLHVSQLYSDLETTSHFEDLLNDDDIEGIVVATPVGMHYGMAKRALEAGKSVLVEKPMATSNEDADDLVKTAREKNLILMVGHTFEYSAPVLKMHEIIASGELGDVFYISSVRANLGLFQRDVNVTWDLATHDISIILNLMDGHAARSGELPGREPLRLRRRGCRDADAALRAQRDRLRPRELAGSQQDSPHHDGRARARCWSTTTPRRRKRSASTTRASPQESVLRHLRRFPAVVPLRRHPDPAHRGTGAAEVECEHFVDCIINGRTPNTDGRQRRCAS